ncbi:MAG: hypothetical protein DSZ24_06320 [Thermodesulfatator sp.]|nr:MAG: hypothetical protein DSZ24_06320 [Thermodesulfatator sp.]
MDEGFPLATDLFALREKAKRQPSQVLELDVAHLVRKYLYHLESLLEKGLDRAGEYLGVIAYLVYLKSRLLLPAPSRGPFPEEGNPPETPSRISPDGEGFLETLPRLGRDIFVAPSPAPQRGELSHHLEELLSALLEVLQRASPPEVKIPRLEPLFQKILEEMLQKLEKQEKFLLKDFMENYDTKIEKLLAFVAILELSFRKVCRLLQGAPFTEIEIVARTEEF